MPPAPSPSGQASGCLGEALRLGAAGLAVFIGVTLFASLAFDETPDAGTPWWFYPLLPVAMIGLVTVVLWLFNRRESRPVFTRRAAQARQQALEREGVLVREHFRATRAFEVEEFEDEGPHCFVELDDGSVLYLTGQVLWDYGPMSEGDEDDEFPHSRQFPCTEFEVLRHAREGYIVQLVCRGKVLEPEVVLPNEAMPTWPRGDLLDIDRITGIPYAQLMSMAFTRDPPV